TRVLAYRIQATAFGDLDTAILRRLREHGDASFESARPFAARGPTTREGVGLKSGALLVREWNGRLERVMVLDDGYAWNGSVYRSLSQVAKAITGTNWNGHRFFGLKAVRDRASNTKSSATPKPNSLLDIGNQPTRRRERKMQRFKSAGSAQKFLSTHAAVYNTFNVQRHLTSAKSRRVLRAAAMTPWREAVAAAKNSVRRRPLALFARQCDSAL